MAPTAELAVIGGSGFLTLLEGAEELRMVTPHGPTSDPITLAEVGGRRVAFLPRHGRTHQHPPHQIPYRANLWAMGELQVSQILATGAAGGLRPELADGTFVVPDQLVDRTHGRTKSFYNAGAVHTAFAEPYCSRGRAAVLATAQEQARAVVDGGTLVVVEGPRLPTRAEAQWYAAAGGTVVNMTGQPEAVLARELGICYTPVTLVANLHTGLGGAPEASMPELLRTFEDGVQQLRELLLATLEALPTDHTCSCATARALVMTREHRLWH